MKLELPHSLSNVKQMKLSLLSKSILDDSQLFPDSLYVRLEVIIFKRLFSVGILSGANMIQSIKKELARQWKV